MKTPPKPSHPQAVIIGAGIVGLHVANALREAGHEVYVLEKEPYLAGHASGRNSGVIHAGIFYEPGSFKEKVCIEGNRLTYEWLKKLDVPHKQCGKWVVPEGPGQEGELESFYGRIRKLPIPEPLLLPAGEVKRREPRLRETPAVLVPSTGIVDAAGYLKTLANYLEKRGVVVILNCRVFEANGQTLKTTRGEIPFDLAVNCAGLFSDEVARLAGLSGYEIRPCRGDYYILAKEVIGRPVYHLPVTESHGLGIHLTPTLDGQTLIGPNAFFIEKKDNYLHASPDARPFESAIAYYLPEFRSSGISPAYSGNRSKLFIDGRAMPEFTVIRKKNWIHVLGIESPGLTSAPALSNYIVEGI
ncbi:MAG: NAD(P)/FAD-dependent oxidoreductase [Deltaproteobacteria bacterium]|nr:NAD(P)/FAD-dependent oxidoreductase [Deltaproteobacteria bacterium]